MRLTVRFLGLDLLDIEASTDPPSPGPDEDDDDEDDEPGSCTTYPVGFAVAQTPHEMDTPDRGADD